jgi:hypothetical protein
MVCQVASIENPYLHSSNNILYHQIMKIKFFIAAAILFFFVSSFVMITGISGKWTGIVTRPDGSAMTFYYTFKTNNNTLLGSARATNGEYELSDGKVNGDSLSFAIEVDNGDHILNSGKYYSDGDSIKLNIVFMGATMHALLKRDSQ